MVEASPADVDAFTATFSALRAHLQAQIDASDAEASDALRLNRLWDDADAQRGCSSGGIRQIASPPALLLASLAAQNPQKLFIKSLVTYTRVPPSTEAIRQSRKRLHARRELLRQRVVNAQTAMDTVQKQQLQRLQQSGDAYERHMTATHSKALRRLQALFVECIAEMSKAVERARHASSRQNTSDEKQIHEQTDVLERDLQWRWFLTRLEEDLGGRVRTRLLVPDAHEAITRSELSHTLAEIDRVIASSGPVLDLDERVVVDTLVAVRDAEEARADQTKAPKTKPSLHFVESMAAAWAEIAHVHTPPTRPASGSTSSRKPRRLSPPLSSSTPVLFASSVASTSPSTRQISAPPSNQISVFPMDTPLSCSSVSWLLGPDTTRRLFNLYVYVPTKDVAPDTVRHTVVPADGSSFMCASLQELLQSDYFHDEFLPLLANDKELLDVRLPAQQRGKRIAQLFIAVVETSRDELEMKLRMELLTGLVLHELCLLYIARGAHMKKPGSRAIASLAMADALSVLPRASVSSSNAEDKEGPRYCVIRFPRGLLRAFKSPPDASWIQKCPTIFIEYHIEAKTNEASAQSVSIAPHNKREKAMTLLGSICSWRSCLDEATHTIAPNGVRVCGWHKSIQTTFDAWGQFTPSMKELKASLKSTEDQSETETVKKMLLQSSSLLQELTSRQLGQSISTFLEFTSQQISNAAYEESSGYEFEETEPGNEESVDEDIVTIHKAKLQLMKEVLLIEQTITATMRSAKKNGLTMPELHSELREFEVEIKTDNYELLRELSRRKLAILQRRLEENAPQRVFGGGHGRMMHSVSDAAQSNGRRATLGQEGQLRRQQDRQGERIRGQPRGSNVAHLLI